jgi:hypothetical protein
VGYPKGYKTVAGNPPRERANPKTAIRLFQGSPAHTILTGEPLAVYVWMAYKVFIIVYINN